MDPGKNPKYDFVWSGGDLIIKYEKQTILTIKGNQLTGNIMPETGSLPLSSLASAPTLEAGAPSFVTIITTGTCLDGESIEVGDDEYILRLLTDDTTDDAANGDFDNENDPLVLPDVVTSTDYANVGWELGDLLRLADEVMEVIYVGARHAHLKRGVSGTTIAAHADGTDIFQHATPASPAAGQIHVGIVGTAAADMRAAVIADINSRGTESFRADIPTVAVNDEIFIQTADAPGGNYVPSERVIGVDVTATNIEIETTAGHLPAEVRVGMTMHVVKDHEVTNGFVQVPFGFPVAGFCSQAFDTDWITKSFTDKNYAVENRVVFELDGATQIAATDVVMIVAWGG